jgi:succinate-semialdehyde dehydrogenase/glutarate-semialdehyde dehydrogenase
LENPLVQGVSLTGSCKAGSSVAKIAAENLKPQVLELGGSDVFVILSDADLDEAVKQCVQSRTQNNGQSCIAAKRILIEHSVYNQVIELFKNEVSALKIGNPSDTENSVGPLAREDLKDAFSSLINTGKSMGANTLLSIKNAEKSGFYVDVEILEVSDNENILFQEELFGPCFVVKKIQNLDQAISIANDSRFGLSASVWTNDLAKQKQCMEEIESGAIFINQFSKSDSRISFGGIKNSGYGRELGKDGMLAFVNKKTVVGSL